MSAKSLKVSRVFKALALLVALPLSLAAASPYRAEPWLADLTQMRDAIERGYPNLDWLTGEREVSLDRWFDRTANAIRTARTDADARRALDRLVERFADGHVRLDWPAPKPGIAVAPPRPIASIAAFCAARGYDASQVTTGTAAALPGYRATAGGGALASGTVKIDGTTIGIVRIGVFGPHGYPALCEKAVADARIAIDKPCDAACDDRVLTDAYARLTRELMASVERLRAGGAEVLLVDLTRNGGGSDWTEAAARIVSPVPLRSATLSVLRGGEWPVRWRALADRFRSEAKRGPQRDRPLLRDLARRADDLAAGAEPCAAQPCSRLVPAGFTTGLLREAPTGLSERPWLVHAFSIAQFPYRAGVWNGPLIVLIDDETWSAAEQFAALLQDNRAAIVMGARSGGAGCGHLYGRTPVKLANSGALLEFPNCVRFRKDGRNEVGGVVPDVSTGVRANDGSAYAGRLTAARLPEAVAQARHLAAATTR